MAVLAKRYAAMGYPLLPVTQHLRRPVRWLYHRSPLLRHDEAIYLKPYLLKHLHEWLIRTHPRDFLIYGNRLKFRSWGSLMSAQGYYVGELEYHLLLFLTGQLRQGFSLIDVGAHHGVFSLVCAMEMKARDWQGTIHSFEPDPANFSLLQHNIDQNDLIDSIRCHQQAVGEAVGKGRLMIHEGENADNALEHGANRTSRANQPAHTVEIVTLDHLYDAVPRVDLIKVDVQGGELQVLRGARRLIERDQPTLILEAAKGAPQTAELRKYLADAGYAAHGVTAEGTLCEIDSAASYVSWDWIAVPAGGQRPASR